jgi:hypothetical protein
LNQYKSRNEKVAFELGKLQALVACLKYAAEGECLSTVASLAEDLETCQVELWRLLNGLGDELAL